MPVGPPWFVCSSSAIPNHPQAKRARLKPKYASTFAQTRGPLASTRNPSHKHSAGHRDKSKPCSSVQIVAIDMCPAYRAAVTEHLPDATLVVDHFHIVQLATQMVSAVRRRVTATLRGRRVRKDDPEYGLRSRRRPAASA
ncbi:transposase [Saccharopolyspora shandongensis]|uniref:transposase n=1 Tax=Saccharopolyspora shandongensis TaxID=418495 RepID=UPI003F4DF67D